MLMAPIPASHSYPIWQPWPGLDKASFIMHICSAIMDMGPGPRPKAQGAAGPQAGYDRNGGMKAMSKYHPSQGPYEYNGGMTHPVICDQGYDPNWIWIWIWIYPAWDLMIYPIIRRGIATL